LPAFRSASSFFLLVLTLIHHRPRRGISLDARNAQVTARIIRLGDARGTTGLLGCSSVGSDRTGSEPLLAEPRALARRSSRGRRDRSTKAGQTRLGR
jgi:hypothetical protein